MITRDNFREELWADFEGRSAVIQRRRAAFRQYCDLEVPRGLARVPDWYAEHREDAYEAFDLDPEKNRNTMHDLFSIAPDEGTDDASTDEPTDTGAENGGEQ